MSTSEAGGAFHLGATTVTQTGVAADERQSSFYTDNLYFTTEPTTKIKKSFLNRTASY